MKDRIKALKHWQESPCQCAWDGKPVHEDTIQEQFARFLQALGVMWFHCPNEGARGRIEAFRLKRQGVKAGVPDVMIPGLLMAIELKAGKNKPTDSQVEWLEHLKASGWAVCWANSTDEAIDFFNQNKTRK